MIGVYSFLVFLAVLLLLVGFVIPFMMSSLTNQQFPARVREIDRAWLNPEEQELVQSVEETLRPEGFRLTGIVKIPKEEGKAADSWMVHICGRHPTTLIAAEYRYHKVVWKRPRPREDPPKKIGWQLHTRHEDGTVLLTEATKIPSLPTREREVVNWQPKITEFGAMARSHEEAMRSVDSPAMVPAEGTPLAAVVKYDLDEMMEETADEGFGEIDEKKNLFRLTTAFVRKMLFFSTWPGRLLVKPGLKRI